MKTIVLFLAVVLLAAMLAVETGAAHPGAELLVKMLASLGLAVVSAFMWFATGKTRGPGSWWVDNSLRFLSGVLVGGLVVILAI